MNAVVNYGAAFSLALCHKQCQMEIVGQAIVYRI